MTYPSFFSGLGFGGLPLPGTLRMASRASVGYMVPVVMGAMPDLSSLLRAVSYERPRASAISCMVKPVMVMSFYRQKKSVKRHLGLDNKCPL